jgi:RNA polymerase sigma-70 factor, ECF subfamily
MDLAVLADEALMKRVCGRDTEAFRVLYRRYECRIFNFVLRYTGDRGLAEDLLQETFWRVWQAARTFDPARGEFRSWLYKVAINATRSEMSLKRYTQEVQEEDLSRRQPSSLMSHGDTDPSRQYEQGETSGLVAKAMARLSPPLREVVALRCLEGMKFQDIALLTGDPPATLRSRFHRAVTELRRRLAPGEP